MPSDRADLRARDVANLDAILDFGGELVQLELPGRSFAHRHLKDAAFVQCDLRGADFSRCRLAGLSFLLCRMDGASFDDASLDRVTMLQCTAPGVPEPGMQAASFASGGQAALDGLTASRGNVHVRSLSGSHPRHGFRLSRRVSDPGRRAGADSLPADSNRTRRHAPGTSTPARRSRATPPTPHASARRTTRSGQSWAGRPR